MLNSKKRLLNVLTLALWMGAVFCLPTPALEIHIFPEFPPDPATVLPGSYSERQLKQFPPPTPQPGALGMSRLQMARLFIDEFDIPIQWNLHEISPFRDVTPRHPHFPLLETAWRYQILRTEDNYRIEAQETATQLEAWLAFKRLLLPNVTIQDAYNLSLLQEDESFALLSPEAQKALVVLYENYIFNIFEHLPLRPDAPLTEAWLKGTFAQANAAQETLKNDVQRGLSDAAMRLVTELPAGIQISVSPQRAIVGPELEVGKRLFFRLNHPIYPPGNEEVIVEASTLTGTVVKMVPLDENTPLVRVTVRLASIRNGHSNDVYRLNARMTFNINVSPQQEISALNEAGEKPIKNFILPTTIFNTVTEKAQ